MEKILVKLPLIEWVALKYNLKPVLRFNSSAEEFIRYKKLCKKTNFNIKYFFYQGRYYIYISKSRNMAKKVYDCEKKYLNEQKKKFGNQKVLEDLDRKIGILLGYPECCVEFFVKNRRLSNEERIVLALEKSRQPIKFHMNNLHFNPFYSFYRILDYFCCSYGCKESIKKTKKLFNILKKENRNEAKKIKEILQLPVLFLNRFNTFLFVGKFKKGVLKYNKILTPFNFNLNLKKINTENLIKLIKLSKILKNSKSLQIKNGVIKVGKSTLKNFKFINWSQ